MRPLWFQLQLELVAYRTWWSAPVSYPAIPEGEAERVAKLAALAFGLELIVFAWVSGALRPL